MKSLPARPSLDSLRKQAKKLARDFAAGDVDAIARARSHLPHASQQLTQRNAQLVIAREYGYAGWQDLSAEVIKRVGDGLEWAVAQARRAIHDNDIQRLKQLLVEYPPLLSWRGDQGEGGLLGIATSSFGDSYDSARERSFTRAACAELLIDAGAAVMPQVFDGLIQSRARGLLELFRQKRLLPQTLRFHTALGDMDAVQRSLGGPDGNRETVNEAFMCACHFRHEAIALLLLERAIVLDPEFGERIDQKAGGRVDFVRYLMQQRPLMFSNAAPDGPWQVFKMEQIMRAVQEGDLATFVSELQRERWTLSREHVPFQIGLIERATLCGREEIIAALLDLEPALLQHQPPPRSQAFEFALTYAKPHLIPVLTRIWRLPDDLAHAAGMGDFASVTKWFDASGAPALGDPNNHYPFNDTRILRHLQWDPPSIQQVLDTALAFSVINNHFEVADFLLAHGADINTNWGSHEPASILHELVGQVATGDNPGGNYEAMQFLIDRGIDMTIKDYRWQSTARGWARHAAMDEKLARWLEEAEQRQSSK